MEQPDEVFLIRSSRILVILKDDIRDRDEGQCNLLCWSVLLLDRAVDEGGDVVGGGVDLVLRRGHVQLCHQVIEDLDGLSIFLRDL